MNKIVPWSILVLAIPLGRGKKKKRGTPNCSQQIRSLMSKIQRTKPQFCHSCMKSCLNHKKQHEPSEKPALAPSQELGFFFLKGGGVTFQRAKRLQTTRVPTESQLNQFTEFPSIAEVIIETSSSSHKSSKLKLSKCRDIECSWLMVTL